MIADVRIDRLALDQLNKLEYSGSSFTFHVDEEKTYILEQSRAARELSHHHDHSPYTAMPNGSSPPLSRDRPSRTYTLPEIPTGGSFSGLIAKRNAGKVKQRSNSFVMNDTKFLSRSDPARRTWDGSTSPRRQNNKDFNVKFKISPNNTLRIGTLRDGSASDVSKNKRSVSNGKRNNRAQKGGKSKVSGDNVELASAATQNGTLGFPSDSERELYDRDENVRDAELHLDDNPDTKARKVEFSENCTANSQNEETNPKNLIQRTRQLSFHDSSDEDQDISTPRTPKSILKKKDLCELETGIRKTQGVSFNDRKVNCRFSAGLPHHSNRHRVFSMSVYSPRPEITFTCSREFAAAMEDLDDTIGDSVFSNT